MINEWFGEFYDTLQKALTTPNSVSEKEFISYLLTFAKIAGVWMVISVATDYFTSHWTFRWRTAMADYYHENWYKARLTEGASQKNLRRHFKICKNYGRFRCGASKKLNDTRCVFTNIVGAIQTNNHATFFW